MDVQYASNGKGNLGVTLGAIGTGLGLLDGGANIVGKLLGGGMGATSPDDKTVATAVSTIKRNPSAADPIIAHPIISAMLASDGSGNYDFRTFTQSLKDSIDRHGSLTINVPPVPMLSPQGITITLDSDDVAKIESYIEEV